MMFISTVVHLFEFVLLSLLGIMLYKLVIAYRKWKSMSVSYSSRGGDRSARIIKPAVPQNPDYLSISKITVTEEKPADSRSVKEKHSAVILTDYIGEFFVESKPMDLEPYRVTQPDITNVSDISKTADAIRLKEVVSPETQIHLTQAEMPSNQNQMNVSELSTKPSGQVMSENHDLDDEIIQVKPVSFTPVILSRPLPGSGAVELSANNDIPTLRDFVDTDAEVYITVDADVSKAKTSNMMSDKVVLAMLDEAKIVCAS